MTILDVQTGDRVRLPDQPGFFLEGTILTTPRGFAAVVLGRNNLGNDTTDLDLVDLSNGLSHLTQRRLHTQVPQGPDYDTLWTQSLDYELIAVSTGASNTLYRYQPVVYAVTLDGKARELFSNESNIGFPGLAISPDSKTAVATTGGRGGGSACANYYEVSIGSIASGPIHQISGLPALPANETTSDLGGAVWAPDGSLIVDRRLRTAYFSPGHGDCTVTESPDRFYRCATGGSCTAITFSPAAKTAEAAALARGAKGGIGRMAVSAGGVVALAFVQDADTAHPTVLELSPDGSVVTLLDASSPVWSG